MLRIEGHVPWQVIDEMSLAELSAAWADFVAYTKAREQAQRQAQVKHGG